MAKGRKTSKQIAASKRNIKIAQMARHKNRTSRASRQSIKQVLHKEGFSRSNVFNHVKTFKFHRTTKFNQR